jgi:hypothetical protein
MTYAPPAGTPSAPPAQPKKKGLHPLAWVAIGCGALLVVGLIVMAVLVNLGVSKVKQFAKEAEEKPVTTLARTFAALNPEVELVEADEETRRITFRNTKTGETMTFDADDIEDGRITFETPEGKVSLGAEGGEEGGTLTVTSEEGTAVFRGGSEAGDIPDWVVRYPGAELTGTFTMNAGDAAGGSFSESTADSLDEVFDYYQRQLKRGGFELQVQTFSDGSREQRIVIATSTDPPRNQMVTLAAEGGRTQAAVQYGSGNQ